VKQSTTQPKEPKVAQLRLTGSVTTGTLRFSLTRISYLPASFRRACVGVIRLHDELTGMTLVTAVMVLLPDGNLWHDRVHGLLLTPPFHTHLRLVLVILHRQHRHCCLAFTCCTTQAHHQHCRRKAADFAASQRTASGHPNEAYWRIDIGQYLARNCGRRRQVAPALLLRFASLLTSHPVA
jgi:hypothetical protein